MKEYLTDLCEFTNDEIFEEVVGIIDTGTQLVKDEISILNRSTM